MPSAADDELPTRSDAGGAPAVLRRRPAPPGRRARALRAALLLAALAPAGLPAAAETWSDPAAITRESTFGRYIVSKRFYLAMGEAAAALDRHLGIACNAGYDVKVVGYGIARPVEIPDGATEPTSGAWSYRYDVLRCGASKRYNLLMAVQPDGSVLPIPLLPGRTIASPQLMSDTLQLAYVTARLRGPKGCEEVAIFDTEVTALPHTVRRGDASIDGTWSERWTVRACGRLVELPIDFVPDGKGGTDFAIGR